MQLNSLLKMNQLKFRDGYSINCFIAGHRLRIYFSLKMIPNFLHSLLNVFNFLDDKHYQKKFFKIITHNMELNYMPEQNVIYLR